MALNIDGSLGLLSSAISVHEKRAELISNNFANSDTPGFKARDIDFRAVLNQQADISSNEFSIDRTNKAHLALTVETDTDNFLYRNNVQPSLDGNTVDPDLEKAAFAENSMRYMSALTFTTKRMNDLMLAIKGTR
jgi:flagellar basal-body rod protein FlgB